MDLVDKEDKEVATVCFFKLVEAWKIGDNRFGSTNGFDKSLLSLCLSLLCLSLCHSAKASISSNFFYLMLIPLIRSHSLPSSLSLSLTHSHSHTLSLSLSLTLTHTHSLSLSLSLSLTHTLSLSLSLSLTHSLSLSLSLSLSRVSRNFRQLPFFSVFIGGSLYCPGDPTKYRVMLKTRYFSKKII